MNWLRCLCSQAVEEPVSQPEAVSVKRRDLEPFQSAESETQLNVTKDAVLKNDLGEESSVPSSVLLQSINTAFARLSCTGGGFPLYRRINVLLETCRLALGASDARLACFSTDGSVWVFLPSTEETDAVPRAAGWGYTPLYGLLSEQADAIAVLRNYHAPPSQPHHGDPGRKHPPPCASPAVSTGIQVDSSQQQQQQHPHALQPEKRVLAAPAATAGPDTLQTPPQPPWRTAPPDPFSLAIRSATKPTVLQPTDLIALPARQDGRLVASLLLGWAVPPAAPQPLPQRSPPPPPPPPPPPSRRLAELADPGPSSARSSNGGMELSAQALSQLQLLAQYLAFGIFCDSMQARSLEQVARRLSTLPAASGLHDLIMCLLAAVPEVLYTRFEVRMQPIFLLTHGLQAGGPAVLFTHRQQQQQQQGPTASSDAAAALRGGNTAGRGGAGSYDAGFGRPASAVALDTWNGAGSGLAGSVSGLPGEGPDGASRIRAVRISLHHTLLAEALRAATKQATTATAPQPAHAQTPAGLPAGAAGGAGGHAGLAQGPLGLPSAASSPCGPNQMPASTADANLLEPPERSTLAGTSAVAVGGIAASPPPGPSMHTTIVPNMSVHMLEEGAPCRDLLLCANMAGCGLGSLVLCIEGSTAAAASNSSSAAATAAAMAAALSAGGASAPENVRVASSQANLPNLSALSQPLGLLHSQRQFGMYLVCSEMLPVGLLRAMALELQMLLGMALYACRDGPLSVLGGGGGRCTWELYSLQEQLLGLNPCSIPGGGSMSLASVMAAATAVAPLVSSNSLGVFGSGAGPAAGGAQALMRAGTIGLSGSHLGRRAAQGRPLPRSLFAVASSGNQNAGGIRSAGSPRLLPSQMHQLVSGCGLLPKPLGEPANAGGSQGAGQGSGTEQEALDEFAEVSPSDVDAFRWMLASSPEVMLEAPAAGPSPLEVMVSSMRTGLAAALTTAMVSESTDKARAALNQELAAIRLYDVIGRGGQGVVFHGTLHGLETAVKVIVHRGKGEPLAHDGGGEVGEGGNGGEEVAAAAAAADEGQEDGDGNLEDLSRIRKAKRGAMELVVTGAMSHPNIVQVLASFSDVIMVRCTYRNEPTPRLRLVAKDDPILATWASPGPLNTVVCLEYCDGGTLLEAALAGAFRPPGTSVLSGAVRPVLVPLYTSLLEVALALRYLHSRRLVHCDLKPANVLLKSSTRDPRGWVCKLSDFGCVRLMSELQPTVDDLQRSLHRNAGSAAVAAAAAARSAGPSAPGAQRVPMVVGFRVAQPLGTIAYMAPECFIRSHTLGASVDIYAFGILMYELLMCRAPYVGIDAQALPRLVLRQHLRPEFHPLAPPEYCHLAARCWSSHVSRRPTAAQLVSEVEVLLLDAQQKEGRKQQLQQQQRTVSGGGKPSQLQPQPAPLQPRIVSSAGVAPPPPHVPSSRNPVFQQQQQQSPAQPQQQHPPPSPPPQQQEEVRQDRDGVSPPSLPRMQAAEAEARPTAEAAEAAEAALAAAAVTLGLVAVEPQGSREAAAAAAAAGLDGILEVMLLQPQAVPDP